ncbi:hypothetical protein GQ55_9G157900 [Panicum hallii var. hallii]|uniref:TF-B3 domain-containing protein n=1 Tax=Panicum hallii var. hallii TaxID=1504633 RepID=A0A2T7C3M4_9POAL|nr:hypothetical protein GQ55_9G157900 [Panicum hallii var. hallii]
MSKKRESCKERDIFFDWNHKIDQGKHFFRIMIGDFVKECLDVQVINNQGKVSLGFGWEAFVSSHDLSMGDFLVFKYDRRSHLKVLIFDSSGCEKLSSVLMDTDHKSQRKEPVGMPSPYRDISMKSSPTQKQKVKEKVRAIHSEIPIHVCVMTKSNVYGRSRCMNFSRQYADAYLRFEKKELMLQCNGKIWVVPCSKVGRHIRLWKGWKQLASDNNLQLDDICLLEVQRDKEYTMNVHIICSR